MTGVLMMLALKVDRVANDRVERVLSGDDRGLPVIIDEGVDIARPQPLA